MCVSSAAPHQAECPPFQCAALQAAEQYVACLHAEQRLVDGFQQTMHDDSENDGAGGAAGNVPEEGEPEEEEEDASCMVATGCVRDCDRGAGARSRMRGTGTHARHTGRALTK